MPRSSTQPYDPPPVQRSSPRSRSSRPSSRTSNPLSPTPHQSIPQEISSAFTQVEHFARSGEHALEEVERFARTGREVTGVVEREYGSAGRYGGVKNEEGESTEVEDGSAEEMEKLTDREDEEEKRSKRPLLEKREKKEKVVPYTSPVAPIPDQSIRTDTKKVDTIDSFRNDLDATQEKVDDLFDLLEIIATERFQLTGAHYNLRHLLVKPRSSIPSIESSSSRRRLKRSKKLVQKVLVAKKSLLSTYQEICDLTKRYTMLKEKDKKLAREYTTLNSSFAKILDFVEDRAKEEREDVREGRMEARLLEDIKEDHPEWEETKRLGELKRVKEEVKRKGYDAIDLESYTGKWLISNPFTELDRTALQQIDLQENKQRQTPGNSTFSTPQPKKEDVWSGLGNMISNVFTRSSPSPSRTPTPSSLELGRPKPKSRKKSRKSKSRSSSQSQSHSYHELSHRSPSHPSLPSSVSTDSDEARDVEKQRSGIIPVRKTEREKELEMEVIPYQVPSDDTSGYVESKEELVQDQKDRLETEHFWTPFVIIEWVMIVLMIIYWAIARILNYDHPLGNLELGKIVGNDAWNDTKTYYNPISNETISTETGSSTYSALLSSNGSNSMTGTLTGQAAKLTLSSTGLIHSSMVSRTTSASTSMPTVTGMIHSTMMDQD